MKPAMFFLLVNVSIVGALVAFVVLGRSPSTNFH
jgi:hypothetical protein